MAYGDFKDLNKQNYTNQLLEMFKKELFIWDLKIIFGGTDLSDMQLLS